MEYIVKQMEVLDSREVSHLVQESKGAGFRFLEKLVNDFENGTNTFNKQGESLFGVFNKYGVIIAIGGLNSDPFANNPGIGRLRRFYVANDYRRSGIGTLLLNMIISEARNHYKVLVLHTDTEQAAIFYSANGFCKSCDYPNSTHYINL